MSDFTQTGTVASPLILEPISLTDVERQCRITDLSAEAEAVEMMISAVREAAEGVTNRALIRKTQTLVLDSFPSSRNPIYFSAPPLVSVDSIVYTDAAGAEQTLDLSFYRVVTDSNPNCNRGYILPLYGLTWPVALNDSEVVTVTYTCGYLSEDVPKGIKQWILLNVANLLENRESVGIAYRETKFDLTESIADGLIAKYRIPRL